MNTEDLWAGEFGDQYTARNRVNWRKRIPFWKDIIDSTGARSVFELGCNAGWNLSAITRVYPDVTVRGEDINRKSIAQASLCLSDPNEVWVSQGLHSSQYDPNYELVFTAGLLIHVEPDSLHEMMSKVVNSSCDYVLAIEYASDYEREIEYRGRKEKLWARPFGKLYQDMGLKLVMEAGAGPGFDDCTAWLLRK